MRQHRCSFKVITILLLMITLLLSSFTSCDFFDGDKESNKEPISKPELVRLMVASINTKNDSDIYSYFSAIPEKQRQDVSYSDYAQYIDALQRLTQPIGNISGYHFLSGEDKTNAFQQLIAQSGISSEQFRVYGNLEAVDFSFDDDSENEYGTECRMFIGIDSEGNPFLPSEWIKQTNRLYTYINLYYSEIDKQNVDALMSAMNYTNNEEAVRARALSLIDFYRKRVMGDFSSFVLRVISPLYAEVYIPEVLSDDRESLISRTVVFKQYDSVIENNDIIPVDVEINQFFLYSRKTGLRLLTVGNNYSKSNVESLLGRCLYSSYNEDDVIEIRTNSNGEEEEVHKIICNYNGMMLIFEGIITDEDGNSWEGVLTAVKMYADCDYVLGGKVTYGVSKSSLLKVYPFIDEYNYKVDCSSGNVDYELTIEFDENDRASAICAQIK